MARAFVGGLWLEIPEGWADQSMVTLIGPPIEGPKLMRTKQPAEDRPSIVVKREVIVGKAPPLETFAGAQEAMMEKLIPGTRVEAKSTAAVGTGPSAVQGVAREFVIPNPSGELRQIQVYFFLHGGFFVFAGTGPNDVRFDTARKLFQRVLSGMRTDSGG